MKKLIYCFTLLLLASCVEVVAVGSVVTGVIIARDKSIADTKDDIVIASKITKGFTVNNLKTPKNSISIIVNEQRVLLTGIIDNTANAQKAVKIAWKVRGVKEVINELQLVKKKSKIKSFFNYSRDSFISAQIKTRLFFNKDLSSINFKTTTVNGTVYLIGVARNNFEIRQIANLIAKTRGTKKVVSYIILTNDLRRNT